MDAKQLGDGSLIKPMNANQLNAEFKKLGIKAKVIRGLGYYYWDNINAKSVYVSNASDLTLETWIELAKEASE